MNENPKVDPPPLSNTEKDPDDWVSGDEPMTGAQASYLKTLTEQLGRPGEFSQSLTKAEASKRIDAQRDVGTKARGRPLPKHTLTVATSFVLGGVDNL